MVATCCWERWRRSGRFGCCGRCFRSRQLRSGLLARSHAAYIDALAAHDPAVLPVAASVKYTENGARSELGETVWTTFTKVIPGSRLDFADPVQMNVATQFSFYESEEARQRAAVRRGLLAL